MLRAGGRIVVIEAGRRGGLAGLLRPAPDESGYQASGGAVAALTTAGFRAARLLAEREGYRFTEAMKS